mgnify:CR=1 FL=1|jgi:hypothetical protein|tara:strand:- start:226 stop:969 length:744 start_codon:yes stop_codon:yes gene_type:complete
MATLSTSGDAPETTYTPGDTPESSYTPSSGAFSGNHVAELSNWLAQHGVDPDAFTNDAHAKSLPELLTEVERGETTLDVTPDGTAIRRVNVLRLLIRNKDNAVLTEAKQEWSDGRVRFRGTPLSEKIVGGEEISESAKRAVAEELGSCLADNYELTLDEKSATHELVERTSMSYPGLQSQYRFVTLNARLTGLPEPTGDSAETKNANASLSQEPYFTSTEQLGGGKTLVATWVWRDETDGFGGGWVE